MNRAFRFQKIIAIATRKETASVALILVFLAAALCSIFLSPQIYQWRVHEGDIALKNIYAPYDFTYVWGMDEERTLKAKEDAVRAVPFFLRRDVSLEEETRTSLERFFDLLEREKKRAAPASEKVAVLRESTAAELSDREIRALLEYPDPAGLRAKALNILGEVFSAGYIAEDDLRYIRGTGADAVSILDEGTGVEIERPVDDLAARQDVLEMIAARVSERFVEDRRIRQAVADLVSGYASPNLFPDEEKTEAEKHEVLSKVSPVHKIWTVRKNELIIEKGKRVNDRHIAQISQLRRVFRPGTTPTFFLGVLLLFLLLGLIAAIHMAFTRKTNLLLDPKTTGIVLLSMFFMVVVADLIMRSPQPGYFIPMAAMGMILTLLVGFNMAFLSTVLLSLLISLLIGGKIELALVLLVGSVVGMFAVRGARRRAQILWAALLVGLAKFLAIACIGLINGMELDFYAKNGVWCVASGLLSGFIVMGLLPVFEHLFNVSTNISLLELSDLNHPLLKRLAMEAPGTYHHSIMVGNLAEAACDAIRANSLLARVGSYYHDVGKIPKAEYFSENEMGMVSRHTNLAPSMSALIIAKHVKDGVEIAKKYKLNMTMIDFISQHHGDSLIAYFYQKALEKAEEGKAPREENFRYPGPRPQTKESAIVLLADSVEAASRSHGDRTPSSIRNLVKKIINNKFIDGQLDECDLTLKDMHKIADSFVRVLTGVFHTRLEYPESATKTSNMVLPNDSKSKLRKPKPKKKD